MLGIAMISNRSIEAHMIALPTADEPVNPVLPSEALIQYE